MGDYFFGTSSSRGLQNPPVGCRLEAGLLKSPLFYHPPPTPPVHRATVFKGPVTSELVIWHAAAAGHWSLIGLHCSGGFSSHWIQALSFNLDPTNLRVFQELILRPDGHGKQRQTKTSDLCEAMCLQDPQMNTCNKHKCHIPIRFSTSF